MCFTRVISFILLLYYWCFKLPHYTHYRYQTQLPFRVIVFTLMRKSNKTQGIEFLANFKFSKHIQPRIYALPVLRILQYDNVYK
jgi:hypothetical protein